MSFALPVMLGLLVLVPVLVVLYLQLLRRRAVRAAELAKQGFVPNAAALKLRRRRHVPFAFFLAALTLMLIALARPQASVSLPRREGTVILAFDVSNSMKATDIKPTRMEAAKAAAKGFVEKQPSSIQIGVVAFSDGALITRPPTKDKAAVLDAIKRLTPAGGTSLGQGMFMSLNAIAGKPIPITEDDLAREVEELDIGYFGSAAVVMLSDGENTSRLDPKKVAELASVAGVKVYPIGLGSAEGTVVDIDGFQIATALDEELLTEIAEVSDGTYYQAADETALAEVYNKIDLRLESVSEKREITGLFTGASAVLLVIGAGLSLFWLGRMV